MKACLLNQSSSFIFVLFGCLLGRLWEKYKSNFPGKGTEPIQKLVGKLKGLVMLYFRIGIDFRYCDFYVLILGLCESESESQSESESGNISVVALTLILGDGVNYLTLTSAILP